jgi:hypothetical protein
MFDDSREIAYFLRQWDIYIFPSTEAPNDPHFDGQEGVGGVTGFGIVKLYLEDKKTDLIRDIFRRVFRKNVIVISHELSHAALIFRKKTHKVALRNDDWSGHKKGDKLNFSTAEVHDRHVEGRFKTLNLWFWDWKTFTGIKLTGTKVIDIDDLV